MELAAVDSGSVLEGDVNGVCGVVGKGTVNSLGVRLADTGCDGDFRDDVGSVIDLVNILVSDVVLVTEGRLGRSANGSSGTGKLVELSY